MIGFLPEEKSAGIQGMGLQKIFQTKASEWREVMREKMNLSQSIESEIVEFWEEQSESFKDEDGEFDAVWFSRVFADRYLAVDGD